MRTARLQIFPQKKKDAAEKNLKKTEAAVL